MSMTSARRDAPAAPQAPTVRPPTARRWSRPSWRDRRLVLGTLLLLASTVLGARLLGTGSEGTLVWAARHDLPAGTALREEDVEPRTVELGGAAARYVAARSSIPAGASLGRAVGAGELVPVAAVTTDPRAASRRTVTLPVERFHAPADLARGDRVDVYVTPEGLGRTDPASAPPSLIAPGVLVVAVEDDEGGFGGAGGTRGVVVELVQPDVARLVEGLGRGTIDLVRVPASAP